MSDVVDLRRQQRGKADDRTIGSFDRVSATDFVHEPEAAGADDQPSSRADGVETGDIVWAIVVITADRTD